MNKWQRERERYLNRLEKQFERELIQNYQSSLKEIRKKLDKLYEATDGNWVEAQKYNRLAKLEKEIAEEIGKLTGKNAQTLGKSQRHIYEESYYSTAYVLSNTVQSDLGFTMLDRDLVKGAIENPLDRVGYLQRNRENHQRLTRQLREHLTQGLIQGESYHRTSKRIKERMDIGASAALRIAQTENHRVRQKGKHDSALEGQKKGLEIKKVWMATIDGDTRESHQIADGQEVDLDKPFDVDGVEMMYPGDGPAEEVINCRCEMTENVEGFKPNVRTRRLSEEEYQKRLAEVGGDKTKVTHHEIVEYKSYEEYKKEGLIPPKK